MNCKQNPTYRPLIGIAPSHSERTINISTDYVKSVYRAGGIPVILPYHAYGSVDGTDEEAVCREYADLYDGFLFSGGVDLNPALYGEEISSDKVEVDDIRDAFELMLFKAVFAAKKPILGICRGIQTINVALGGTLYQHIDGHSQSEPRGTRPQSLNVVRDGWLYGFCHKDVIAVNSYHHQNIKDLAPGLAVDGVSPDGYIEAVHHTDYPFLFATQFHPEIYNRLPDDDHSRAIFSAFVGACR